jgi:uncharacterized peroxidase-related enzyme
MARIAPITREDSKDFETMFAVTEAVMGFVPNSMLVMARDPDLLAAFARLAATILIRPGRIDPGLKALIMYMASRSAGCQYCVAHTAQLAISHAVPVAKAQHAWEFETSSEFSEAECAALRFAQAAGRIPNGVTDAHFAELRRHFDEDQILEIVAAIALMGFLNRWNDTLATPLEPSPREFAQCHLASQGWAVGKHTGVTAATAASSRTVALKIRIFRWLLNRLVPKPHPVSAP